MIDTAALIAVACLIANKGPLDMSSVEHQLNASEKTQVQSIIQSGACLPESVEQLLLKSNEDVQSGKIKKSTDGHSPCTDCG